MDINQLKFAITILNSTEQDIKHEIFRNGLWISVPFTCIGEIYG